MKSIAICFLFTLSWMTLFINASEDENKNIFPDLSNAITQNFQQDVLQPSVTKMAFPFQSFSHKILFTIFNKFLTIREILILRKTCTDFKILLNPNDEKFNVAMFCKDFSSKEMDNLPLMWFDLKYFLDQSYTTLKKMEMLNLKQNQYAVFTSVSHRFFTCDKMISYEKIISWYNQNALHIYPKMILNNKIKNEISQPPLLDYETQKIYTKGSEYSWAKITNEGNVITGGVEVENESGDSNHVQSHLKNVKMIFSTRKAFAALLENGSVVAWGDEDYGGEIPELIASQLHQNVKMIFSNDFSFAALLGNGRVVAWGNEIQGGIIPDHIQTQLHETGVKMIVSNCFAFVALLGDSSVVAWGRRDYGGEIPEPIQIRLQNVQMIFANDYAFTALFCDGRVIAWGKKTFGGKIPDLILPHLKNVKTIFSSLHAFAALLHDGSVFAWGYANQGGKIPDEIQSQLHKNVKMIFSNDSAFIALLNNGRFVAWGSESYGGKITYEIENQLKNVKVIYSSSCAFAALLNDGCVFTWGLPRGGGIIPEEIQFKLMKNVKMIIPQKNGFTALCNNGEIITWGNS